MFEEKESAKAFQLIRRQIEMMECVWNMEFSFQQKMAKKAMLRLRWFDIKILPAHIT